MAHDRRGHVAAREPTDAAEKGGAMGDLAVCVAAYLYGSLPLVYLLGRRGGADLRALGSGNVGASNLWAARGAVPGLAGWLFDASKGLLPVVAARRLGYRAEVARLAGVCGVAGQCWPAWPSVGGGRGISAFVGATFAMDRAAWGLSMAALAGGGLWRVVTLGRRGKDDLEDQLRATRGKAVPLGCFIGVVLFPLAASARGDRRSAVPVLLTLVILLRRLTAPLPDDATQGPSRRRAALLYRLLYDRNTSR